MRCGQVLEMLRVESTEFARPMYSGTDEGEETGLRGLVQATGGWRCHQLRRARATERGGDGGDGGGLVFRCVGLKMLARYQAAIPSGH